MSIPLVDLRAQYLSLKPEIDAALQRVISRTAFIGGEEVERFETEFAAYCADPELPTWSETTPLPRPTLHCAGCGNGTDALYLTLRALGIGRGDEVITTAHTFIATAEAITLTGARPVFVDIREDTMLIDSDAVEAAITPRTAAILPVHLYGQPCDMDRLAAIARRHCLAIVEDAAQAHGARWNGQRVGQIGDAACFSFYPGKNLGAYGDGGAVVSKNPELVRRVRMLANHGRLEKYTHSVEGVNSRLDSLQAAILRAKLHHLDQWNAARRWHADYYLEALRRADLRLPVLRREAQSVWHLFVIRVHAREMLAAQLKERGISTGVHYPVPLHLQPAYAHLEMQEGSLPVTERVAAEVLSLPMCPELTDGQVEKVAAEVLRLLPPPVLARRRTVADDGRWVPTISPP